MRVLVARGVAVFAADPLEHRRAAAFETGTQSEPFESDVSFEVAGTDDALAAAIAATSAGTAQ